MLSHRDPGVRRRNRRAGGFRWLMPVVGGITPALLIVVNIAAFIVHHLQTFQLLIAILAFISSLMLNSWLGVSIFRFIKSRAPDHGLVHERNYEVIVMAGMAVMILIAFATAFACYQGLSSEKDLPNVWTFFVGVISILVPIIGREIIERFLGGSSRRGMDGGADAGLPV